MTQKQISVILDKSQPIYMGIDVHKKTWSMCLVHRKQVVGKASLPADFEVFKKYLKRYEGFEIYSVYEAGFCGFSLHRQLISVGIKNIITPVHKVPKISGDRVKTDKIDCFKLAHFLANGLLRGIYIPTEEQVNIRQIVRTRDQLKRKRVRVISQIKNLLFQLGIFIEVKKISQKLRKELLTTELPSFFRKSLELHFEQLDLLQHQLKKLYKELEETAEATQQSNTYHIIKSTPSVGSLLAMALTYEVADWRRFNNEKQICAFFGLTPSEFSSGERVCRGNITGQGSPMIRALLVQASWKIIKKDPVMGEFYERITTQTGSKKKAIVAVARKLMCRIYSMVKNKREYALGLVA